MPSRPPGDSEPPATFATQRDFEIWLRRHQATHDGVWLLIARPGATRPTITYPQAVEAALCHGP